MTQKCHSLKAHADTTKYMHSSIPSNYSQYLITGNNPQYIHNRLEKIYLYNIIEQ